MAEMSPEAKIAEDKIAAFVRVMRRNVTTGDVPFRRREKVAAFESRRAWSILNRIEWLQKSGCKLSAYTRGQAKLLRTAVPNWKEDYGAKAAESLEGRTGWVRTNTSYEELAETPISQVLRQAKERSGRSDDFLVENDPVAGLAGQRPARAFAALTYAAKRGDEPPRVCRRLFGLSHAAMAGSSSMA